MYSQRIKIWPDEKVLLAKIARGREDAFAIIYNRFRKKIYTFSLQMLKSEEQAEEVMQETFLKLWQLQDDVERINNLEVYLRTLTRNKCLNVIRRLKLEVSADREMKWSWDEAHNETEEHILLRDTTNVLKAGIALLPQQQRQVYQLCREEGLKYEEVAERLNLSPLTVQTHMKMALRFLRNHLSKHTDLVILTIIFRLF
ncbi:RNA polymerase sigma-70 factor [Pedobacter nyackensis]|uniref:RNA polymerase sigma factor n=1 Tax=Pedobacter nyackensis TaxID=475255 RepID=UPI002931A735|nr:RNA polymerase sigma-70 factor [Pedobacter nyackensis]